MTNQIIKRCMKFKLAFIFTNILLVIVYATELLIPYVFSNFIDLITQSRSIDIAINSILLISIFTIILMMASYIHHILSEVLITKVTNEFLNDIDDKLENIPLRKTEKYNPAYLNNRIFNDILTSIGFVVNNLIVSIVMLMSTIVLLVLIININFYLVFIPLGALAINISGILLLNKMFYRRGYQYKEHNNQYLSDNHDRISHIKETKIHAWYNISSEPLTSSFKTLLKSGISLNKVLAVLNNIGQFSKNLTLVFTMLVGGSLLINQTISIGEFILIIYYTNMCLSYSEYFLKLGQEYQHAKISYHRLEEFMHIENENNGPVFLNQIDSIKITNLSFSYPEKELLFSGFEYTLTKGHIYCLKGKNGEGKSTLIDVILGLDYRYEGSIQYNHHELLNLDMIKIRKEQISVILQEPRLQRLSVKENITRGVSTYSQKTLDELCTKFELNHIIDYDESLSLSSGEKQKVSIVRGLLKNTSLLILDEPVSAMDVTSVKILKEELVKRKANMIIMFISHNEELYDLVDEFIELPNNETFKINE